MENIKKFINEHEKHVTLFVLGFVVPFILAQFLYFTGLLAWMDKQGLDGMLWIYYTWIILSRLCLVIIWFLVSAIVVLLATRYGFIEPLKGNATTARTRADIAILVRNCLIIIFIGAPALELMIRIFTGTTVPTP